MQSPRPHPNQAFYSHPSAWRSSPSLDASSLSRSPPHPTCGRCPPCSIWVHGCRNQHWGKWRHFSQELRHTSVCHKCSHTVPNINNKPFQGLVILVLYVVTLNCQTRKIKAFTDHTPLSERKPFVCKARGIRLHVLNTTRRSRLTEVNQFKKSNRCKLLIMRLAKETSVSHRKHTYRWCRIKGTSFNFKCAPDIKSCLI